jgi:hypothetical protein
MKRRVLVLVDAEEDFIEIYDFVQEAQGTALPADRLEYLRSRAAKVPAPAARTAAVLADAARKAVASLDAAFAPIGGRGKVGGLEGQAIAVAEAGDVGAVGLDALAKVDFGKLPVHAVSRRPSPR